MEKSSLKNYLKIGGAILVVAILAVWAGYSIGKKPVPQNIGGAGDVNEFNYFSSTTLRVVNTSTLVLDNNYGRTYAMFVNNSANAIYLNLSSDSTTVSNYTVRLNANGGSYEILPENLYTGIVYASSSASSDLLITEK